MYFHTHKTKNVNSTRLLVVPLHFCQSRTGNWGYNSCRFAKIRH